MPAATTTDSLSTHNQTITLLHFNDCYNVEPRAVEPAGGAARFKAALDTFSHCDPIVLFSGDILGPSISKEIHLYLYTCLTYAFS